MSEQDTECWAAGGCDMGRGVGLGGGQVQPMRTASETRLP